MVGQRMILIVTSAIDKMFGPIFEQNTHLGPIFEKSAYFGPFFVKSVNFEHFVNGR